MMQAFSLRYLLANSLSQKSLLEPAMILIRLITTAGSRTSVTTSSTRGSTTVPRRATSHRGSTRSSGMTSVPPSLPASPTLPSPSPGGSSGPKMWTPPSPARSWGHPCPTSSGSSTAGSSTTTPIPNHLQTRDAIREKFRKWLENRLDCNCKLNYTFP